MSVTQNWCPSGVVQFRRAFPVTGPITKNQHGVHTATCATCGRPGVPVLKKGDVWQYSGHTESTKVGGVTESGKSYSKRREQRW